MLSEGMKVVVSDNKRKQTGIIVKIINNTVFIKLDMESITLPFDLNQIKRIVC